MEIIAHRGLWTKKEQQNTMEALLNAIRLGYGIETDIREHKGNLVISHDIASGKDISLDSFLQRVSQLPNFEEVTIALNVKEDGLEKLLQKLFSLYRLTENMFFFDMSSASHFSYSKIFRPENIATRQSDIEPEPVLYEKSGMVWIDCVTKDWSDMEKIKRHLDNRKKVAFVSPELHKRDYKNFWDLIKRFSKTDEVMICTDFPEKAREFFKS